MWTARPCRIDKALSGGLVTPHGRDSELEQADKGGTYDVEYTVLRLLPGYGRLWAVTVYLALV